MNYQVVGACVEFFTISPQYKNDNIANFILAVPFTMYKKCNTPRPTNI